MAGNFIVVFVTLDHNGDIPTVMDNTAGNPAYTLAKSSAISGGTALIYYRENITTVASFTITVTTQLGTTQFMSAAAAEFSGVATSGSLEANPPSNSGSGTAVSTGAIVGTAPTDLYIGVFTDNNTALTSITSGQTQLYNEPSNTNAVMGAEYLIGSGTRTMTWTTNPSCSWTAVGAAFKVADTSLKEQEGFRFRLDDGSQSGATWLANQDTNITRDKNLNTRLRLLLNATGDPASEQYQLEYKKSTDSGWSKVSTSATAPDQTIALVGNATEWLLSGSLF